MATNKADHPSRHNFGLRERKRISDAWERLLFIRASRSFDNGAPTVIGFLDAPDWEYFIDDEGKRTRDRRPHWTIEDALHYIKNQTRLAVIDGYDVRVLNQPWRLVQHGYPAHVHTDLCLCHIIRY